jgi:homoserine kinase
MILRVRAPATTANIGPGFDCAGAALDLWNELELRPSTGTSDEPVDRNHLGVRAFERLVPADGWSFQFTDSIPQARGLGSSASVIALGLVAAATVTNQDLTADELLALGLDLEGHGDNLAAALAGGVCLTWGTRIARIADTTPATPVAVIPAARGLTAESRAALPQTVPHADAAFSAGRAALLGAALAGRSANLFEAALQDRLHEPYRAESAPLLGEIREQLPATAVGVTLSGAGPTVIVWARLGEEAACTNELRGRFPNEQVLPLTISQTGAGAT